MSQAMLQRVLNWQKLNLFFFLGDVDYITSVVMYRDMSEILPTDADNRRCVYKMHAVYRLQLDLDEKKRERK